MWGVFVVALSVLAAVAASCAKIGDAHGTAAFGLWTPESVILAADSKIVHLRGEPPESACKIRSSGRFYFLLSGFYGRPKTAFDAWKVVEESARSAKTIDEASPLSERVTLPLLRDALERARTANPNEFLKHYSSGEVYFGVLFAGTDSGETKLVGWELLTSNKVLHVSRPTEEEKRRGGVGITMMGEYSAVESKFSTERSMADLLRNPEIAAQTMVQVEIDGESKTVGAPISVLSISSQGARWVRPGLYK